jgi:CDP-diacylglycerol--glycerol-3-phosphate 3-phosphatidyltransferase
MTLPDKVTSSRLLMAPLFFAAYFLPQWTGNLKLLSVVLVWSFGFLIELSDMLDGLLARRLGKVHDTGKYLDPFADSLSRLTYFVCFTFSGIMPVWIFLIILYREIGISFIRILRLKKDGTVLSAEWPGKFKAVGYVLAGGAGVLTYTFRQLGAAAGAVSAAEEVSFYVFCVAALAALMSFVFYLSGMKEESTGGKGSGGRGR